MLCDVVAEVGNTPETFAVYNARRIADLEALGRLALYNERGTWDKRQKVAGGITNAVLGIGTRLSSPLFRSRGPSRTRLGPPARARHTARRSVTLDRTPTHHASPRAHRPHAHTEARTRAGTHGRGCAQTHVCAHNCTHPHPHTHTRTQAHTVRHACARSQIRTYTRTRTRARAHTHSR